MADELTPLDNNEDLTDIEAMLRDLDPSDLNPVEPPADVWAGIEESLRADAATGDSEAPDTNVVSISNRRQRFLAPAIGIAAAAVLAITGAVLLRSTDTDQVVASATLEFDAASFDPLGSSSAAAVSLVDADAGYEITFDESTLPSDLDEPADLELWLIEPDADGKVADLVSLGIVENVDDPFVVPDGYDPAIYRVVDISVEPHDGNHDHSGRSILRGALIEA